MSRRIRFSRNETRRRTQHCHVGCQPSFHDEDAEPDLERLPQVFSQRVVSRPRHGNDAEQPAVCDTFRPEKTRRAIVCLSGVPLIAVAAAKRIPTHEDIWLMKRVGPPQVSPDGRWLVVPVAEPSYDDNAQLSDLWLIDTAARHSSRRLTSTRRPENGVTWSPDSRRIVFSAQRDNDDVAQLYSLDLACGW